MKTYKVWLDENHEPQAFANKKETAALVENRKQLLEQLSQNPCYDSE